jgi:hypothetical protein
MVNIPFKDDPPLFSLWSLREKQFDDKIRAYIAEHPHASVMTTNYGKNS